MLNPTWETIDTVDDFFVMGRNLWPDLKDLQKNLTIDRTLVSDKIVRFIRSTSLNEYGIGHYVKGYHRAYGDDYKMAVWACIWGAEEYLHSVVLRLCLKALGEDITPEEFTGLEFGEYERSYDTYLEQVKVSPVLSTKMLQLVYTVLQEYSAYVAYTSVSEACGEPVLAKILKRMGLDEMRHCRFYQLSLEEFARRSTPEEVALIWPQFRAIWNRFWMPQEHINLFQEQDYATELYIEFWTPSWRTKMAVDLTHFFKKFRTALQPEDVVRNSIPSHCT